MSLPLREPPTSGDGAMGASNAWRGGRTCRRSAVCRRAHKLGDGERALLPRRPTEPGSAARMTSARI